MLIINQTILNPLINTIFYFFPRFLEVRVLQRQVDYIRIEALQPYGALHRCSGARIL